MAVNTPVPQAVTEKRPLFRVTVSPHVKAPDGTRSVMLDVIIALLPALCAAVFFFGWRALTLTVISVAASVFFEWGYRKLMKKPGSVGDLSAIVTGMLLAFCCPASMPYWMVVIGDLFAIVVVKQLYGGIGKNFMNPALAARVFLLSWPASITKWTLSMDRLPIFGSAADAVTGATPLSSMSGGALSGDYSLLDMFLGQTPGCLGEVSAVLLIVGGIYLLIRRVITLRIPFAFIATVALLTFVFPRGNDPLVWMTSNLLSGGLVLGAFFMATDYTTSPATSGGQWIYGVGCGLITVFIRYFGSYPEGVSFSILIMNACAWLLDKAGKPRRFGTKLFKGKEGSGK